MNAEHQSSRPRGQRNESDANPETRGLLGDAAADPSQSLGTRRPIADRARPSSAWTMDRDAMHFGARMAASLTVSSLFVLVQLPGDPDRFPEGMWVLITVLFVCWFPTMDAASVLEKSVQRLVGTLLGAALALVCGFLSLAVADRCGVRAQAAFLAGCIALVSFAVCGCAVHARIGSARLIETKNYATILCILTFTICLMPFYSVDEGGRQWEKSMYRVMNVVLGCFLGIGLSMIIFPRPTVCIIQEKLSRQIELAGEASEAVLKTAADTFAEKTYHAPLALADEILGQPGGNAPHSFRKRTPSFARRWRRGDDAIDLLGHDVVLEKYEASTKEWRAAKCQLGMLKYDPFNLGRPNDLLGAFRAEAAQILARAMRIQTTVVLIDGIVRNDPKHNFSEEHLELLAEVGALVRRMLSVPLDVERSDPAARELGAALVAMRRMIVDLSATVSSSPESEIPSIVPGGGLCGGGGIGKSSVDLVGMYGSAGETLARDGPRDDMEGTGAPKHVQGSHVCSLLFLQLAEHLALRSVRLYQSWRQYEGVCQRAESLKAAARDGPNIM